MDTMNSSLPAVHGDDEENEYITFQYHAVGLPLENGEPESQQ